MDQLIFSSAVPGFYLLFPCNGGICIRCGFNINQLCYIIFCRKAIGVCVGFMLPNSALQVTCHAGVKGHMGGACQDVYHSTRNVPPSCHCEASAYTGCGNPFPRPLCKGITDSHDQSADWSRNDTQVLLLSVIASRGAHWLWQSVLPVLGAGVLRIPTTSLRTGLGMTRKFFRLPVIAKPVRTPAVAIRSPCPSCRGIADSHDQSADWSRNDTQFLSALCHCEASANTGCGNPFSSSLVQGYYGFPRPVCGLVSE